MSRSPRRKRIEAARKIAREEARGRAIPLDAIMKLNRWVRESGNHIGAMVLHVRLCVPRRGQPRHFVLIYTEARWRGNCPLCHARTVRVRFPPPPMDGWLKKTDVAQG